MTNAFTNRFWDLVSASFGDSANRNAPAIPPIPPAPTSQTVARMKGGYHVAPWYDTAGNMQRARVELRPQIVRVNYPAFPLFSIVAAPEAVRLVGLIEAEIEAVRSSGARVLVVTTLAHSAPASQSDCLAHAADVSAYYALVAKKYPGCAWEPGNEQEIPNGLSEALSPAAYATVFEVHARAIRAADPTATVVTAGMSGFGRVTWIQDVLTLLGAAKCLPDAVGIHPYGASGPQYPALVRSIGTTLPVWFTEYGVVDSPEQGRAVNSYFTYARWVTPVAIWFCLSDRAAPAGQPFGLIDANDVARFSYSEIQSWLAALRV